MQRDLAEERDLQLVGEALPAPGAEDRHRLPRLRRLEVRHVLDDAEHRDADAAEHHRAAQRVADGDLLRRGHDDRAGDARRLHQRELRVAGARGHVDEEDIELPPRDVAEELRDDLHHDRPAPDRRLVALDEETERDELHAVRLEGLDLLVLHRWGGIHAHHPRDVRPVDVGVHQADAIPGLREGDGEVRGDGRLADASLPRRHGDDATEARVRDGGRRRGRFRRARGLSHHGERPPAGGFRGGRGRSGIGWRGLGGILHVDAHVRDAFDGLQRLPDLTREDGIVLRTEEEGDADFPVARGGDVADLLRLVEGSAGAGIGERGERLGEARLECLGHQYDGKVLAQEFW